MADLTALSVALESLKTAYDMAKAMLNLREAAAVQGRIIELQEAILSAQDSAIAAQHDQFSLLETIRELEKQKAELEAWDAEKDKYELTAIEQENRAGKILVYVLKEEAGGSEPKHYLCPRCYQEKRKSILQPETLDIGQVNVLVCQSCGGELNLKGIRYESYARPKLPRRTR